MVYCTVCMNNNRKNKNISFFNYPNDSTRRQEWLQAVGREDLLSKLVNDKIRQRYRICEHHFEISCIKFSKKRTVKYLYSNAFPTLNLPTNDAACSSSSQCENVSTSANEIFSSSNKPFKAIVILKDRTSGSFQTNPDKQPCKSIELDNCKNPAKKIEISPDQSLSGGKVFIADKVEKAESGPSLADPVKDIAAFERSALSIKNTKKKVVGSAKKRKLTGGQYSGGKGKGSKCPYCSRELPPHSCLRIPSLVNGGENFNHESGFQQRNSDDGNIIFKVYDYLQREYESLQASNTMGFDLSPLANILKRTADATGLNEQTVAAILSERHNNQNLQSGVPNYEYNYHTHQMNREEDSHIYKDDIGDGMERDDESQEELIMKCEVSEEGINEPSCSNKFKTNKAQVEVKIEPEDEELPTEWPNSTNESVADTTQVRIKMELDDEKCSNKPPSCSNKSITDATPVQIKLEPDDKECSSNRSSPSLNNAISDSGIAKIKSQHIPDKSIPENALYVEVAPTPLSTSSSVNTTAETAITQVKMESEDDFPEL